MALFPHQRRAYQVRLCLNLSRIGAFQRHLEPASLALPAIFTRRTRPCHWTFGQPCILDHPLGPLFGGIAVDLLSWQVIFWVNVPLCLIVLYLMRGLRKPPYEPSETVPLDIIGSTLVTLSLGFMTYALMEAGRYGRFSTTHLVLLAAGLITFCLFVKSQYVLKSPMIPPTLFSDRRFLVVNFHTLILFAVSSATFFYPFLCNPMVWRHTSRWQRPISYW